MADAKDTGRLELGSTKVPVWLVLLLGLPGLGGMGLGVVQSTRTPSDLGEKIDTVMVSQAALSNKIDVLTTKVEARDRSDDRERTRIEKQIEEINARLTALERRTR